MFKIIIYSFQMRFYYDVKTFISKAYQNFKCQMFDFLFVKPE